LTAGGSSAVHIYTQTIHRTTQLKENVENRTYITIKIHDLQNLTKANKTYNHIIYIYIYTGCPRRKGPNFGRVFLRSNYTDITQNTYIQSAMVTEIMAREV